ncbi:MAG: hypothetical protein ABJP45_03630 [Cyclobacteriaceae bacterium]
MRRQFFQCELRVQSNFHKFSVVLLTAILPFCNIAQVLPNRPIETSQLEPLIGTWITERESLSRNGEWIKSDTKGIWNFEWGLKGHAIIDTYELLHKDQFGKDSVDFSGINVRIFDPKEAIWKVTWVENVGRNFAHFTAKVVDGRIEMEGVNPAGRDVKVFFYEVKKDSFLWRLEWSFDDGKSWVAISRMKCSRI